MILELVDGGRIPITLGAVATMNRDIDGNHIFTLHNGAILRVRRIIEQAPMRPTAHDGFRHLMAPYKGHPFIADVIAKRSLPTAKQWRVICEIVAEESL